MMEECALRCVAPEYATCGRRDRILLHPAVFGGRVKQLLAVRFNYCPSGCSWTSALSWSRGSERKDRTEWTAALIRHADVVGGIGPQVDERRAVIVAVHPLDGIHGLEIVIGIGTVLQDVVHAMSRSPGDLCCMLIGKFQHGPFDIWVSMILCRSEAGAEQ